MPTNIAWTDETTAEEAKERLEGKYEVNEENGCWEWTAAKNEPGYGRIRIDDVLRYAHRVSYRLHEGELGDDDQVNHKCDNPTCINPDHLYVGTQKENIEDAVERGEFLESKPTGEDHPKTTLDRNEVEEIRELYKSENYTHRELAERFCVGHTTIGRIVRGDTWTEGGQ